MRNTAEEKKRVRDAMDAARDELFFMIRALPLRQKKPLEANHNWAISLAIEALKSPDGDKLASEHDVLSRSTDGGRPLKKLPHGTSRDEAISLLQQARPPRQSTRGRLANTVRKEWLADIIENIRLRGFDPTRGDESRLKERRLCESPSAAVTDSIGLPFWLANACAKGIQQSACSIVAAAWRELADEARQNREPRRSAAIRQGWSFVPFKKSFKKHLAEAKALSERSLEAIWENSEWWAELDAQKRQTKERRKLRTSRR